MDIIIRKITQVDYRKAIEVVKRTHKVSFKHIYPQKLIEEFCKKYDFEQFALRAEKIDYFIAEDKETKKILGIIGIYDNHLRSFFVDPQYQGKGIGRKLYDFLENEARKRDIKELLLEGSPLGEPIYQHFGFIKLDSIEKERAGIKYTDALMKKIIR